MKANQNWKTIAGWVLHGLVGGIMLLSFAPAISQAALDSER